jgi:hypothetical protein
MPEIHLSGIGIHSDEFAGWPQFCARLCGEPVADGATAAAQLLPARERRRAPPFVRLSIEVMDQACRMGAMDRTSVATVFGSAMGDMQITDYMCRILADEPGTLSPTKFHNSVHNASTGYWSIATGSGCAASAVSAYRNSAAVVLLEGSIQANVENVPVVVAVTEIAAPIPLQSVCDCDRPLALALLLTPARTPATLGKLTVGLSSTVPSEAVPVAHRLLEFLTAVAQAEDYRGLLPLSDGTSLTIEFSR